MQIMLRFCPYPATARNFVRRDNSRYLTITGSAVPLAVFPTELDRGTIAGRKATDFSPSFLIEVSVVSAGCQEAERRRRRIGGGRNRREMRKHRKVIGRGRLSHYPV